VQLLRFENAPDTELAAQLISDITWVFRSDTAMIGDQGVLWMEEQRAIGELMLTDSPQGPRARGYAQFAAEYNTTFAPWLDPLLDAFLDPSGVANERLRLLEWALFGLVTRLDQERSQAHMTWYGHVPGEIKTRILPTDEPDVEQKLLAHLRRVDSTLVPRATTQSAVGRGDNTAAGDAARQDPADLTHPRVEPS
jgi:hypothetical protein